MDKKFQFGGATIHYKILGEGEPVLLIHGFGEDSRIWDEQVAFLSKSCKLIVPDLPGSGTSELLSSENVSIEDYADCMNALLDNENIGNCIILGHSMGGYITLAFAEKYAEKLMGFGFVHSTAFADSEDKKNVRRKAIEFIKEHGAYTFLKNTTPNLFADTYKKEHSEKVAELVEEGRNFSNEALIQYYSAMINRLDKTSVLEKSKVPVLFIVGTRDPAAPLEDLLKQVHLPKVSYIHILNEVGHMGMLETPSEVNRFLQNFIKDCIRNN